MAAAEKTATKVFEIPLSSGLMIGVYTAITTTAKDWVILSSFSLVKSANAFTSADGTTQEAYCSGANNYVYMDATGACTILAIGVPAESTGGD